MSDNPLLGTLPPQATKIAVEYDTLYAFILYLSIFFFVLVVGAMVVFIKKYHASKNSTPGKIDHNTPLELAWTIIPTIILAVVFAWGFVVYKDMTVPPGPVYEEINIIGYQWRWDMHYDHMEKPLVNELVVPAGKPIGLVVTSADVLHSFFIPDFRIKKDAVPGMYTKMWFQAEEPGEHIIYCAEYCGTAHSGMLGKVKVLSLADYEDWKKPKDDMAANLPPEKAGEELATKYACIGCHSADGKAGIGPTFKGLYGKTENLADGSTVQVDDDYLRKSILEPNAQIVKGYNPGMMPTFKGQLDDKDIMNLIAYIKSLK